MNTIAEQMQEFKKQLDARRARLAGEIMAAVTPLIEAFQRDTGAQVSGITFEFDTLWTVEREPVHMLVKVAPIVE